MKLSCDIIKDILPLYAENLASQDTRALVESHLAECDGCRAFLAELQSSSPVAETGAGSLNQVRREISRRRWYAALLAFFVASTIFFAAFVYWNTTTVLRAEEAVVSITQENGLIVIKFADDAHARAWVGVDSEVIIQCQTSPADRLFTGIGIGQFEHQFFTYGSNILAFPEDTPRIWYAASGNGEFDVLLWGEDANFGQETLPRLAMGYYFLIALGLGLGLGVGAVLLRKKKVGFFLAMGTVFFWGFALADVLATHGRFTTYDMSGILFPVVILALLITGTAYFAWKTWRISHKDRI